MNWYKKAQIDKESGLVKSFLGLTFPFIAILLGMSYFDIESKIQNNPEQLTKQIQQAQETQKYLLLSIIRKNRNLRLMYWDLKKYT